MTEYTGCYQSDKNTSETTRHRAANAYVNHQLKTHGNGNNFFLFTICEKYAHHLKNLLSVYDLYKNIYIYISIYV